MKDPNNHKGWGYTEQGHYACYCGFPVSGQISPVAMNHPASQNMISKMKQAWHTHKELMRNGQN